MESRSWVIVRKETGKAVHETFDANKANEVRKKCSEIYDVVPIVDWLHGLNKSNDNHEAEEPKEKR